MYFYKIQELLFFVRSHKVNFFVSSPTSFSKMTRQPRYLFNFLILFFTCLATSVVQPPSLTCHGQSRMSSAQQRETGAQTSSTCHFPRRLVHWCRGKWIEIFPLEWRRCYNLLGSQHTAPRGESRQVSLVAQCKLKETHHQGLSHCSLTGCPSHGTPSLHCTPGLTLVLRGGRRQTAITGSAISNYY